MIGLLLAAQLVLPTTQVPPPLASAVKAERVAPVVTDLEACHVDVSLQNETIVVLKIQLADLQKLYDLLQLQADLANRTPPPKEGFTWDWTRDPQTGQPK